MKLILMILTMITFTNAQGWLGFGGGFGGWNKASNSNGLLPEDSNTLAHWWLNSTNKDTLKDLTGNGHDLTASAGFDYGDQFTNDAPGGGKALKFDGVNDRLLNSDTLYFAKNSNFSIEIIANMDNAKNYERMFAFSSPSITEYMKVQRLSSNNNAYIYIYPGNIYVGITDIDNSFNYYVFTFNGDTIKSYRNGLLSETKSGFNANRDTVIVIGLGGISANLLNGDISEFSISGYKTASEISATWDKIKENF